MMTSSAPFHSQLQTCRFAILKLFIKTSPDSRLPESKQLSSKEKVCATSVSLGPPIQYPRLVYIVLKITHIPVTITCKPQGKIRRCSKFSISLRRYTSIESLRIFSYLGMQEKSSVMVVRSQTCELKDETLNRSWIFRH
jgi:hypothetical protein